MSENYPDTRTDAEKLWSEVERGRWGGPSPFAGKDSRTDAQKRGREQDIAKMAAELAKHDAPRFRDGDREDRGALNCRCGVRIPPKEPTPYRDWDTWYRHVAEALYKAKEGW